MVPINGRPPPPPAYHDYEYVSDESTFWSPMGHAPFPPRRVRDTLDLPASVQPIPRSFESKSPPFKNTIFPAICPFLGTARLCSPEVLLTPLKLAPPRSYVSEDDSVFRRSVKVFSLPGSGIF